jgi:hypothetical protein
MILHYFLRVCLTSDIGLWGSSNKIVCALHLPYFITQTKFLKLQTVILVIVQFSPFSLLIIFFRYCTNSLVRIFFSETPIYLVPLCGGDQASYTKDRKKVVFSCILNKPYIYSHKGNAFPEYSLQTGLFDKKGSYFL